MSRRPKSQTLCAGVGLLLVLILPLLLSSYYVHVLIMILLFGLIATSWSVLAGMAGQISLGHALFVGIGAYTSTLLYKWFELSPWIGMWVGGMAAMAVAGAISYLSFRCGLHGPYFALITFAFAQAFLILVTNLQVMGGGSGLNVPLKNGSIMAFQFEDKVVYYYIVLGILSLALFVIRRLSHTRTGYYLLAIRENETAAESLGVAPVKYKMTAALVSALFAALGGTFYAQYVLFVDPQSFLSMNLSLEIMIYSIVGGVGMLLGPLVGAGVLIPVSEAARTIFGNAAVGAHLALYAIFLIWVVLCAPNGIMGWVENRLRSGEKEARMNVSLIERVMGIER